MPENVTIETHCAAQVTKFHRCPRNFQFEPARRALKSACVLEQLINNSPPRRRSQTGKYGRRLNSLPTKKLPPGSKPIFWPRSRKKAKRRKKSPRSPARSATNPSSRRLMPKLARIPRNPRCRRHRRRPAGHVQHLHHRAIICAAAGVTVAKHGNRAVTSQAGSADVLEALGIRIDLTPEEAARSLREHNFAFFFAPNYHPAFKNISPRENSAPNAASGRFSTCSARC
jgi:hypothetical protein